MKPSPTGTIVVTPEGRDLVLTRTYRAPIEDVWASITESECLARWYGSWTGESGVGRRVKLRLLYEEGEPVAEVLITACDPPHHLAVQAEDGYGEWKLEVRLRYEDGATRLEFVHHLDPGVSTGEVGPGWEYYLDRLTASRDGSAMPDFDDYFPALQEYYAAPR